MTTRRPAQAPEPRMAPSEGSPTPAATEADTERILRHFHEEQSLGRTQDWRMLERLWGYMKHYRGWLVLALVSIVVTAAAGMARPLIMRVAIDSGVLTGDSRVLFQSGVALAAVVLVEQLLVFAQIYATQVVGARSLARLRRDVFAHLHRLRVGFFDQQPIGRLVTRVTNDIDAILELFASGSLNAVGELLKLLGIVVLMVMLDPWLSLIAFAALPPVAALVWLVRRRGREAFREIRTKTARMNATMNEYVAGVQIIQAFRQEEKTQGEFDAINGAYRDAYVRSIKYEAMQDAAIETVAAWCLAFVVVALGYHSTSFGTLVAFNAYLIQFFQPISTLAQHYTLLQSGMAGAERVFALLDIEQFDARKRLASEQAPEQTDDATAFEFSNVDFEYKSGVPVLRDIGLKVAQGERIALVGPTGSGKTTLASLLLRLYEAQRGSVRVFGREIGSFDRDELRQLFAVVPQDLFLFPGTVASNVAAGDTADLRRVEAALRQVGAYELVARRPGGLHATVEEQGVNFSAGERQLIAFARALYRDAPILILDEATASVDSDTEARVQVALERLLAGRTALVIAHRLSTIRAADRIVVFRGGRIVEQGKHNELVAQGGLYARLHALQFVSPGIPEPPPSGDSASTRT